MQLKEIKDYYESLCEKFPDVSEKDIKRNFELWLEITIFA